MSTRGSVAWRLTDGSTLGIYNHNCSQPTVLGRAVHTEARKLSLAGLVAKLKQHQQRSDAEELYDPFQDPLSMEWVYVVEPNRDLIEVWASAPWTPELVATHQVSSPVPYRRGYTYVHVHIADIPVSIEPDWVDIEQRGKAFRT